MTTHLPADIELTFTHRKLVDILGAPAASFVFLRLWCDLAFQSRLHGQSGLYQKDSIHHFVTSTKMVDGALTALTVSGLVQVKANGDWFCPLFYHYNAHLDISYIPATEKWLELWDELEEKIKAKSDGRTKRIPQSFWYQADGSIITELVMGRAISLIFTLDFILHRNIAGLLDKKPRNPAELDIGTVQGACALVTKHSAAKLTTVLRRFLSVSRPRLNPGLPNTTELAVKNFDDLVIRLLPDEGFEMWSKQLEHKHETQEIKADAISRELLDKIG